MCNHPMKPINVVSAKLVRQLQARSGRNYPAGSSRRRRGAVTVETAVTIGIAILFFFASMEFCRVGMIRHTVQNALYEGARTGTLPGATSQEVIQRCNQILATIALRNATVTVNPTNITSSTKNVTVSIRVPVVQNLFSPAIFFQNKIIDDSLTMRTQ